MQTKSHNTILEYSVSEISRSIKIVVESSFNLVKIRGEISNLKFHNFKKMDMKAFKYQVPEGVNVMDMSAMLGASAGGKFLEETVEEF